MDLRIENRRLAIIKKVETCENEDLLDEILVQLEDDNDPDYQVVPMTLERYRQQTEEALEDVRQGKVYSTEQIRVLLRSI
jgi:hypothetical protein